MLNIIGPRSEAVFRVARRGPVLVLSRSMPA
jgi:hypothetical protein